MRPITRRGLLVGSGALAGVAAVKLLPDGPRSVGAVLPTEGPDAAVLNDASELNPVRVAKHITIVQSPDDALIELVRNEIAEARSDGRALAVGAARHSMGGQSLPVGGTAITLDQDWLEPDTAASTYLVAAGARWRTVISQLDNRGFSPVVMQSNNDFGVGSTFCVNAHGWPVPFGPFGSTVRSFRMILGDGELVVCTREQNRELFELAMGGYGLAGVIVDLVVEMVPNRLLAPRYLRLPASDFADRFVDSINDGTGVSMAYGRLDVVLDRFLDEALIVTYADAERAEHQLPPAAGPGLISDLSRVVYRAQNGSDGMKSFRWWMENNIAPMARGKATRNSLMNEPVATLEDRDATRCDILHEYFVPPAQFAAFLDACRAVIPSSYQELLNITLRYVKPDGESILGYAPEHRIAAVMAFSQEKSVRAEEDMTRVTRNLIDKVIELGGTYYLPYRLHASSEQLRRAYPRLDEFIRRKLVADPDRVFRNALWDRYMSGGAQPE
jgi:FAD/FMN-containing dehydrogenase